MKISSRKKSEKSRGKKSEIRTGGVGGSCVATRCARDVADWQVEQELETACRDRPSPRASTPAQRRASRRKHLAGHGGGMRRVPRSPPQGSGIKETSFKSAPPPVRLCSAPFRRAGAVPIGSVSPRWRGTDSAPFRRASAVAIRLRFAALARYRSAPVSPRWRGTDSAPFRRAGAVPIGSVSPR